MSQRVTIVGPNLPKQKKAEFHVHAEGCSDLQRGWIKQYLGSYAWTIEVESKLDVESNVYDFAPAESEGYVLGDYQDQFHFAPCVTVPVEVEESDEEPDDEGSIVSVYSSDLRRVLQYLESVQSTIGIPDEVLTSASVLWGDLG